MKAEKRVCLGAFAGAHGVRGEAKVKSFTASEDGVARYGPVETEDGSRLALQFIRTLRPGLALVRSPDIKSREQAAALAGVRFYAPRSALPEPDTDEFYLEDLVGLAARDENGSTIGVVVAVYNFGAGDILEIRDAKGAPTLVPFTRAAVPVVDLRSAAVTIAAAALPIADDEGPFVAEKMRQEEA